MSIEVRDVCYVYEAGSPHSKAALDHVSLTIEKGEFIGIIGHTGSGKSTLIQHLNGLLKPTHGEILYDGVNILEHKENLRQLRQKVGLVFQYPEHQLFEMTIWKDVAFGPTNMKLPQEEISRRVESALSMVGISSDFYQKSPFELSGGQKRRVAIAGVLAMEPDYLVLDEPTAGLDPMGRDAILGKVMELHRELGMTAVLVSHSMEDVARYVNRILVMDEGRVKFDGEPRTVFSHREELEAMGLGVPQVTKLGSLLQNRGFRMEDTVLTVDQMVGQIRANFHNRGDTMLRDITIGQYYPVDSVIHRLDPRTKIVGTIVYIIALFLVKNLLGFGIAIIALAALIYLSKVPFRYIVRGLKTIVIILLFTVLLNMFLTKGDPLVHFWIFTITRQGVYTAGFMGLRLILLIIGSSLMTLTTTPIQLTDGIESLLRPLKKIKVPAHDIAMMMSIALRFIPILLEETDKIMKAQMARGADFESGNLLQRAKSMVPILVPLFISAFRRADELATAMEARCYRGDVGRTRMKELHYGRRDAIAYLVLLLFVGGLYASRYLPAVSQLLRMVL